jgi:hypothetical protein
MAPLLGQSQLYEGGHRKEMSSHISPFDMPNKTMGKTGLKFIAFLFELPSQGKIFHTFPPFRALARCVRCEKKKNQGETFFSRIDTRRFFSVER